MASTAQVQYAALTDLQARVTDHDLKELSTEDASSIDETKIDAALLDASTEIDGSLGSRYTVPLDNVPAILIRICCDIAVYRMQALRPLQNLEDTRKRYDDARADLKLIREGKLALGVDPTLGLQPTIQSPNTVLLSGSQDSKTPRGEVSNLFSRGRLRNF